MQNEKTINTKKLTKRKNGSIRAATAFFRSARYGLTLQEHRLIYFAILSGQQEGTPFSPVTISIKQFRELFELKGQSCYNDLRKLSAKLVSKVVQVDYKDDTGKHLLQAVWLTSVKYNVKYGTVTLKPNEDLKPFFEGKPFTSTEFSFLMKFHSQYAERLYEILKSMNFKEILDFSVSDLRLRLGIGPTHYLNYTDFRRRILNPAIQDINAYTDLDVTLDDTDRGPCNRVDVVYFTVNRKENHVPLELRVQKGDLTPVLSEEEQQQLMTELIGDDKRMVVSDDGTVLLVIKSKNSNQASDGDKDCP